MDDNADLRPHGGKYGLERDDIRRYEMICYHIGRVLPGFDRFDIQESYGKVLLRLFARRQSCCCST